ncbi:hypothetical protein CBR_g4370 [Chara braunii]|uniref:pectinesterase n=1 Tax=Chara braunii TaxID=69332 RepID=A0A388KHK4_CHABU|nr:hypothetical protein CBR_g4370 [Chara braunii]|eukprot:GBG69535.1 hypothetical protein CBR_g4370 [Chara braunii]
MARSSAATMRSVSSIALAVGLLAMVSFVLPRCASAVDIIVGPGGHFRKIQPAINHAAPGTRIIIRPGVYHEKLEVNKRGITFFGWTGRTVIVWGDSSNSAGGTDLSATVTVQRSAAGFVAEGITFKNNFGPNKSGADGQQAVALFVLADASFYNCTMDSFQDTLFAHAGRQYYKRCNITGTVDFAMGAGTAFFEDCILHAKKMRDTLYSTYTAQQRNRKGEASGFVFLRGRLRCDRGVRAWLGRGWGKFARTIFIRTWMNDCIQPDGWTTMPGINATTTTFFAEYQCMGPGANRRGRVWWSRVLTPREAAFFSTRRNVIGRG